MTLASFVVFEPSDSSRLTHFQGAHDHNFPRQSGDVYTLPPAVYQHAIKSMRLSVGEQLMLTDGQGAQAVVTITDEIQGQVVVDSVTVYDIPRIKLGLVQALAKSGRDEQAIEMATEIGVDSVIPWQAHRSIVQWKANKVNKALAKWHDIIVSATEQSRRAVLPQLESVMTSKQLIAWASKRIEDGDMVIILHQDARTSWQECRQKVAQLAHEVSENDMHPTIWVVVGPEGGISDEEVEAFYDAGSYPCVIGHNILRASSAGSVALALLSEVVGRYK